MLVFSLLQASFPLNVMAYVYQYLAITGIVCDVVVTQLPEDGRREPVHDELPVPEPDFAEASAFQ
jgi:hypothetical protein